MLGGSAQSKHWETTLFRSFSPLPERLDATHRNMRPKKSASNCLSLSGLGCRALSAQLGHLANSFFHLWRQSFFCCCHNSSSRLCTVIDKSKMFWLILLLHHHPQGVFWSWGPIYTNCTVGCCILLHIAYCILQSNSPTNWRLWMIWLIRGSKCTGSLPLSHHLI